MSAKNFQILNRLGEGSFASVYKVKRLADGKEYAMKKVKMGNLNQKEIQSALNEVRILASIRSPYVIRYKEAFLADDSTSLCIIMEFAAGGDLLHLIQQRIKTRSSFSESEIWQALIQITRALKVLHDHKILHRDLKCANVLIGQDGTVKLGDLNVSIVAKNNLAYTQAGTPYYLSPEVWSEKPYDGKSDIWSLGCLFYEMAALKTPFEANDMQALAKKIQRGTFERIPNKYSADLSNILSWCLQKSPSSRPSCDQLLNSTIVAKYLKYDHVAYTPVKSRLDLLDTIKIPKNMKALSSKLPKANYTDRMDTQESIADKSTENSTSSPDRRRRNSACRVSPANKNVCPVQSEWIKKKVPTDIYVVPQNRLPPSVINKRRSTPEKQNENLPQRLKRVQSAKPVQDNNNNIHRKLVQYFNSNGSDNNHVQQVKAMMPKYKVVVQGQSPFHNHQAQVNDFGPHAQIRHRNDSSAIANLIANYEQIGGKVRGYGPSLWA